MTSRLLGRALRGALTRCRPSTPQLLSSRLAVPRTARFSQAVDTPPAAEAATSSVAAAAAAEPAEEAGAELPVAAAAQDAGAAEEPAAAVPLSEAAMAKRINRAMKDKRYADVLAIFDEMLATYKEGAKPDLEVVDAVLESKALTAGVPAALQMLSLLASRFPTFAAEASSYVAVMQACIPTGDSTTARSLYESLLASGKEANHDIFNTMIMVYCSSKDFDGADQIFAEMREMKIKPKRITYLRFINGCFKAKEAERAYGKLQQMEAEWRVPSEQDYERMFQHFVRLKHKAGRDMCVAGLRATGSEVMR